MVEGRKKLFGTNGVRCVVNESMSPELALRLGLAIGTAMHGEIAIATDTRTSNTMLKEAVVSGLLSTGCNVIDTGIIPTPALQYFVRERRLNGGVVITASHNPPEFNGVKAIASDGTEASSQEEGMIEDIFYSENFKRARWNEIGQLHFNEQAASDYIDAIASKVDVASIKKRKLRVVLDCSNGASCFTSPYLLEKLGVEFITLNAQPQGSFPGHESEPTPEHLQSLIKSVSALDADLGAAHDGDADRTVFVDEKGNYIPGELSLALIAMEEVRKSGGTAVVPVSTPSVVERAVASAGGKTIYTRVGSPVVARKMMEVHAVIGGEENGGIINPRMQYCRDGGMTLATMLEIIAKNGSLSSLIAKLPESHTVKTKVQLAEGEGHMLMERFRQSVQGMKRDETDGIKLFLDRGWVLVRPSGTEPLIRIFAEGDTEEQARKYAEEYVRIINELREKR